MHLIEKRVTSDRRVEEFAAHIVERQYPRSGVEEQTDRFVEVAVALTCRITGKNFTQFRDRCGGTAPHLRQRAAERYGVDQLEVVETLTDGISGGISIRFPAARQ